MSAYTRVAGAAGIAEGEIKAFEVNGTWVGVTRAEGQLYAFRDECTHAECPLSRGFVEGTEIECDCHGATFDLRTGAVVKPPASEPIPVYPVTEDGNDLLVGLP